MMNKELDIISSSLLVYLLVLLHICLWHLHILQASEFGSWLRLLLLINLLIASYINAVISAIIVYIIVYIKKSVVVTVNAAIKNTENTIADTKYGLFNNDSKAIEITIVANGNTKNNKIGSKKSPPTI